MSQEESTRFYDQLNHHIFELVSSSDANERKGGILAIGKDSLATGTTGVKGGSLRVHCTCVCCALLCSYLFKEFLRSLVAFSVPVQVLILAMVLGHGQSWYFQIQSLRTVTQLF